MPEETFDCVLCGSCVVDILVRPVPLDSPIGGGKLLAAEPIEVTTGGIVSNTGVALARLGMKVAAFTYVGRDEWAAVIRKKYQAEGLDTDRLIAHPTDATSTTAVLIDPSGERSFLHCVGAPKLMDKALFLQNMDLFARCRMAVVGYYSLMPNLEGDLPEVVAGRPWLRRATAAECGPWTASCLTWTSMSPAAPRPSTRPDRPIPRRSWRPTATAAPRAFWA